MKSCFFYKTVALLLVSVLIVPSALFITPSHAHAQVLGTGTLPTIVVGETSTTALKRTLESTITAIKTSISAIADVTASAAIVALQIDAYVLQPLAFVLSGNLLKIITQGVINFVIGKANGTGAPQFVADIQASLQLISDQQTLSYLDAYMRSSQSPYAGSIVSALRKDYLNKTSLAGFWAQNMDTLRRTSPNPYGYLRGNWLMGGVTTWFALTTQQQNNPYWLIQSSQSALASLIGPSVGGATGSRVLDIRNGQGFVSWCGESDSDLGAFTTDPRAQNATARAEQSADEAYNAAYQEAYSANPNRSTQELLGIATVAGESARNTAMEQSRAENRSVSGQAPLLGVNPGDPCTRSDGKTGSIKTPGSVILSGLNKALGGQQDSVMRMGNVGPEINTILGNIATVIKTVDFAAKILGGPGSGGLFGVANSSGANSRSLLRQYADAPGNLGVTNSDVFATAASLPSSGSDMLSRVAQYESAANLIQTAVNTASTSVTNLIDFCTAQQLIASSTLISSTDLPNLAPFIAASTAQIQAAQSALTTKIAPVYVKINVASSTIVAARAMAQRVQDGLNSGGDASGTQSIADMQTLGTMPPSAADVAEMQNDATVFTPGTLAVANPPGSLTVSGGTPTEQMNLISKNADALRLSCTAPVPTNPPPVTDATAP
ncbi:MAG: hypothetical protein Q7T37_01075 [bacterium]|nr:hypothetical protein [bacterium]